MPKYQVEPAHDHVCGLGEGPHWDSKNQVLYYVDVPKGDVCRLDVKNKKNEIIHIDDSSASLIIPCSNDEKQFIITDNKKILKLNWETHQTKLLAEVEKDMAGNRLNDGKCDAKGRLWVGTMGKEIATSSGIKMDPPEAGSLYCMDSTLNIEQKEPNVDLSNGLTWSLDNKKMFFIDCTKRVIYVFDFDLNTGNVCKNVYYMLRNLIYIFCFHKLIKTLNYIFYLPKSKQTSFD